MLKSDTIAGMIRHTSAAIIQWEWVFLLFFLPLTFLGVGWQTAVLLLLPILWLLRRLSTGHFIPATPYDTAVLLLMVMVLVSLYATFDIWLSMPRIAGLVVAVFLFYGAVAFSRRRAANFWAVMGFFLLAGAGLAAIGLLGVRWAGPFAWLSRAQALLPLSSVAILGADQVVNPNFLAGSLALVSPLALALLMGLGPQLWRGPLWHILLLAALLGVALLVSGVQIASWSRGGILSLGVAVLVMLAVRFKWGRWLFLLAVVAAVVLFFTVGLGGLFVSNDAVGEFGLSGRLEIWSRAIYGLQDFPFTGMSMNGFRRVVHILYPLFSISPDSDISHAHNQLLQAGLDLGLPGLIAYLALWLVSVWLLWQGWRMGPTAVQRTLLVGLSGSFAAGWMFGVFDVIAVGERPGFLFWLLLALLCGTFDAIMHKEQSGGGA